MATIYRVRNQLDLDGGRLRWHGHSTVSVSLPGFRIYVDPHRLHGSWPQADATLVTHPHYDHLDKQTLESISHENTTVIHPASTNFSTGRGQPRGMGWKQQDRLSPGQGYEIDIEAVPAYNVERNFHPKEKRWLGYCLEVRGKRIYHAGDTGPHEDPPDDVDVALLPVDGIYTMTASEAAQWSQTLEPEVAIPIHYGTHRGTVSDAVQFCRQCSGTGLRLHATQLQN